MIDIVGGANLFGGSSSGKSFELDRFGNQKSALYLNKAYYQIPNGVYFAGDYTFSIWVKMNSINTAYDRIMSIETSSHTVNSIIFSLVYNYTSTPYLYTSTSTDNRLISPTNLPLNQWTHIAFTLSGSIGTIYLNGTNVKQGTTFIPSNTNRTYNYFGTIFRSGSTQDYPNAIFDEVKIFNRCLSQREIQFIINNQTYSSALSISIFFNLFLIFIKLVSHF